MIGTTSQKPRGRGRTAFIARLAAIKAEIAAGEYLVAIHQRHQQALGGITYSGFRKLVQRYAEDAKPGRHHQPSGAGVAHSRATAAAAAPAAAVTTPQQGPRNAGYQSPEPARSFEHDPPGDRKRFSARPDELAFW